MRRLSRRPSILPTAKTPTTLQAPSSKSRIARAASADRTVAGVSSSNRVNARRSVGHRARECPHKLHHRYARAVKTPAPASGDSIALIPPDWSQFVPDVLVAGITGVLVGLAVLWVEGSRTRSRDEEEAQRARVRVTEAASGTVDESFIHAYPPDSLVPNRKALRAIRRAVNAVSPSPPPREVVPAFVFLRALVEQYESLPIAAERVETLIARRVPNDDEMDFLRSYVRSFTYHPDHPWVAEPMQVHPNLEASLRSDRELEDAVRAYGRAGKFLELAREAFNAVDGSWRADMWAITLRQIAGAPQFPLTRWRRRRKAQRERVEASEKAMKLGRDIMSRGGTWFEPRGW